MTEAHGGVVCLRWSVLVFKFGINRGAQRTLNGDSRVINQEMGERLPSRIEKVTKRFKGQGEIVPSGIFGRLAFPGESIKI